MNSNFKQTVELVVDSEWGTISPQFELPNGDITSGKLKYFGPLAGKKVKLTIEILEEEI
jgi:hypothetical protein